MEVVELKEFHFDLLELQEAQQFFTNLIIDGDYRKELVRLGGSCLYDEENLNVIAMAGVLDLGYGRGMAWALLSKDANKYMHRITKAVKVHLNTVEYQRVEITVEKDFKQAFRWAQMLGFTLETEMKNYCNGQTHYLFARYK